MALIPTLLVMAACGSDSGPDARSLDPSESLIQVLVDGSFESNAHPTFGKVELIEDLNTEDLSLSITNFSSDDGPALYVYLATDTTAQDFVNLGELSALEGSLSYEIPGDSYDPKYQYVLIWCEEFSVLFGSAKLQ